MAVVALKKVKPMTLAEMFDSAGLSQYANWSKDILVTPSGRADFTPRPYQISGLNHLAAYLPRSAIWDSPGCGKTLQLQAFMLWMQGLGNKPVAIMPPVLVTQFLESFQDNFQGVEKYVRISTIDGERHVRQKQIDGFKTHGWPDILILSYPTFLGKSKAAKRSNISAKQEAEFALMSPDASLTARTTLLGKAQSAYQLENQKYDYRPGSTVTAFNFRSSALSHIGYNLLISDESQKLKTPSSAIHQAVKEFVQPWEGEESNGLVLSTGSPIETNVEDAYGLISLLDPDRYGSMRAFDSMHCNLMQGVKYRKVTGYRNLDYLYQGLYARGRRITKAQAFPNMPSRVITEIEIVLSKEHRALYTKLVDDQVLELEDKLIDATLQQRMYQYVQQMLICPEKFADHAVKDNAVLTSLDGVLDTLGNQKVMVFAWYQDSIDKLKLRYKDYNPAVINGKVTGAAREKAKQKFISDKSCKMLIANAQSGGVGIDGFQTVCSYMVFAEVFPHPGGFEQAIGRLERSGQTESTSVFLLVPKGTIAVKLRNDLCRKEENANHAIKDKKKMIADWLGEEGNQGEFS